MHTLIEIELHIKYIFISVDLSVVLKVEMSDYYGTSTVMRNLLPEDFYEA